MFEHNYVPLQNKHCNGTFKIGSLILQCRQFKLQEKIQCATSINLINKLNVTAVATCLVFGLQGTIGQKRARKYKKFECVLSPCDHVAGIRWGRRYHKQLAPSQV